MIDCFNVKGPVKLSNRLTLQLRILMTWLSPYNLSFSWHQWINFTDWKLNGTSHQQMKNVSICSVMLSQSHFKPTKPFQILSDLSRSQPSVGQDKDDRQNKQKMQPDSRIYLFFYACVWLRCVQKIIWRLSSQDSIHILIFMFISFSATVGVSTFFRKFLLCLFFS